MKKKLIIDLFLLIIMFFLMFYNLTTGYFHEILGLILFILYMIHIILNMTLLKKIIFKIKEGEKLPKLIIGQLILDIIMFLLFIILIVSSILISKYIFKLNMSGIISVLHMTSAYILFGLIIIHVLLHIKMICYFISNKLRCNVFLIYLLLILILGTMTFFVYKELIFKRKDANSVSNNKNTMDSNNNNVGGNVPTLQEYLSGKHCSGCHNHCALSSIRCNKGTSAKTTATNEYYYTYASITYSENDQT